MRIECVCGKAYWPAQKWQHGGCATNGERLTDATNKEASPEVSNEARSAVVSDDSGSDAGGAKAGVVRTLNRRSREAYNAYQREYMRRRRAK